MSTRALSGMVLPSFSDTVPLSYGGSALTGRICRYLPVCLLYVSSNPAISSLAATVMLEAVAEAVLDSAGAED